MLSSARWCIFLLLAVTAGFADWEDADNASLLELSHEPLYVSLGSHCGVALVFREMGLRKAAFPFDWLLSLDGDRVVELLGNNFENFTEAKYLARHPLTQNSGVLVHTHYHIEFRHDWHDDYWTSPHRYLEGLNQIQAKYQRRIARFNQLDNYQGKVFFIRTAYYDSLNPALYWPSVDGLLILEAQAIEINRALKKRFPHLDYYLVIINENGIKHEPKTIDNILLFEVDRFDYSNLLNNYPGVVEKLKQYCR